VLITVGILGLLASLDPLRPVVFVLVLRTEKGPRNGVGFFIGWALALAVLFTVAVFAFGAGASGRASSSQKTGLSIAEITLAVVLLALALRRRRQPRSNGEAAHHSTPAPVLHQIERLTPRRSSVLGVLIQPRSLTIAAAAVVARQQAGFGSAAAGLGVFAIFSTGALVGLFTYVVRRPDHADRWLAGIAERLEQAGPILITIACGLGGVYLLADGIYHLASG
jgi:hypothetical protein